MNLYRQDYQALNEEEKAALERYNNLRKDKFILTADEAFARGDIMREYRAVEFYKTLFPNNHLSRNCLRIKNRFYHEILDSFSSLLNDQNTTERTILNFIKDNEAYFIIGSIIKDYTDWGHHDRYIFPEFPLHPNFQVDYLICGKNSHGFHFLFVELENPAGQITLQDGSFGVTLRKGLNQINDWEEWNDRNFNAIRLVLEKQVKQGKQLPKEFTEFDKTRISYVLVGGRRSDFNEKGYRLKRKLRIDSNITILHYDNVIDAARDVLETRKY